MSSRRHMTPRPAPAARAAHDARDGHPAIRVTYRSMSASVDAKLAPLAAALWRLGIETSSCCQEQPAYARRHPGYAYIAMPAESAARLAAALCDGPARDEDPETHRLRRRACGDN